MMACDGTTLKQRPRGGATIGLSRHDIRITTIILTRLSPSNSFRSTAFCCWQYGLDACLYRLGRLWTEGVSLLCHCSDYDRLNLKATLAAKSGPSLRPSSEEEERALFFRAGVRSFSSPTFLSPKHWPRHNFDAPNLHLIYGVALAFIVDTFRALLSNHVTLV